MKCWKPAKTTMKSNVFVSQRVSQRAAAIGVALQHRHRSASEVLADAAQHAYVYIHYITLHYITLHYITLQYITLHYITLHYITLHYLTLAYLTLHYNTLLRNELLYIRLQHVQIPNITFHFITRHAHMHACVTYVNYIDTLRWNKLHDITLHYVTLR